MKAVCCLLSVVSTCADSVFICSALRRLLCTFALIASLSSQHALGISSDSGLPCMLITLLLSLVACRFAFTVCFQMVINLDAAMQVATAEKLHEKLNTKLNAAAEQLRFIGNKIAAFEASRCALSAENARLTQEAFALAAVSFIMYISLRTCMCILVHAQAQGSLRI